ncbi:hypothetical protein [Oryzobacter telluris]|uniref:hypothetical protein n=1 Tax=Oryzobacter telluris TaxID=3149179 RepID=UPI00370D4074
MRMLGGPASAQDVLFGGDRADPAAGLALDLGHSLDGHLPAALGAAVHRAVAHDVAEAAVALMQLDLTDVLAAGWQKHSALRAAGRRTRDAPGTRETVVLAEHTISHEAHPAVDVSLGEVHVTRVEMTLVVAVEVTGLTGSVFAGRLTSLASGKAVVTVSLDLAGAPVARRSRELRLPLELDLGQGLRLA